MLFNDIDKSKPYTVLMVTEPIRLACLSFAGLARGVYYIQGDFRSKIAKMHDRRLVQAGLIALRFVSDTEKPDDFVKADEIRAAAAVSEPPSSGISAAPPVEMVRISSEPSTVSDLQVPHAQPTPVMYDPLTQKGWDPGAPAVFVEKAYAAGALVAKSEVMPLPEPVVLPVAAPPVPTEVAVITTEQPAVPTEQPFVVAAEPPLESTTLVVPTETAPVPTETAPVPTETAPAAEESDDEPVVILEDQPKKRRGRKPKQANVVALEGGAAKLPEHEQDRRSAEPVPAPPAEDSLPNENSQALA